MKSARPLSRRRFLLNTSVAVGGTLLAGAGSSVLARALMPTPGEIMGPFYPVRKPLDQDADLTMISGKPGRAKGQVIQLMGQVLNLNGDPVEGARIELWQANMHGRYDHPSDANTAPLDPNFHGYAVQHADAQGRYRFKTIKPGAYPAAGNWTRPPHIHFDIVGGNDRLVTQLYFAGEPLNDKDRLLQDVANQEAVIVELLPPTEDLEADSRIAVWNVVLGRSREGTT